MALAEAEAEASKSHKRLCLTPRLVAGALEVYPNWTVFGGRNLAMPVEERGARSIEFCLGKKRRRFVSSIQGVTRKHTETLNPLN